jgi:hypothetical protein
MNENLKFWESVEKTDPKYTKQVNAGGRKLTAINAQQQIKNATEKWGMYGKTWGLKDVKLNYINNLCNNQVLAVAQAIFFYPDGCFDIGSSILVQSWIASKSYNKVDDDFLKKLETDMTTKALSKVGFNSDVFLGRYDDNKYVQQITQEFKEERKKALTLTQFEATKKATVKQIQTVLDTFRMSGDQRKELTNLLNKK